MRINLQQLKETALTRPAGYYEDVCSNGTIKDGFLFLEPNAYKKLLQKYRTTKAQPKVIKQRPSGSLVPPMTKREITGSIRGLGDIVHAVALPIASILDKTIGTNLSTCGGCQKRREKLNQILPL